MADAIYVRGSNEYRPTAAAAVAASEIYQMPDGRAARHTGQNATAAGATVGFCTEGVWDVPKTASQVMIAGQRVWWDHSANAATLTPSKTDRDFFLGSVVDDAAAADSTVRVNANVKQSCVADLGITPFDSTPVQTAGTAAATAVGGSYKMTFSATAEAQKIDLISKDGFALAANWVVEGAVEIVDDGDAAALDINIGVANATHATDADSITESVFLHTDGNVVNILAESDDGTTEVAATDTTKDYTLGTRFHFCIDGRDPSDVQIYIDGVLVLGAKTFDVSAATGPLYLLFHMEKTSDDTTAEVHVDWFRAWTSQG